MIKYGNVNCKLLKLQAIASIIGCLLLAGTCINAQNLRSASNCVILNIKQKNASVSDTFRLAIYEHWYPGAKPTKIFLSKVKVNGDFQFEIPNIKGPTYTDIFKDFSPTNNPINILHLYIIEPKDEITIFISSNVQNPVFQNDYEVTFSGIGSSKFLCKQRMDKLVSTQLTSNVSVQYLQSMAKENIFRQTIETGEALLKGYKNKMRKEAYNILQADFYSSVWIRQIQQFEYAARLGLVKDEYFKMANTLRNLISNREKSLSPESKNISVTYPIFALNLAGIGKGKGGNSLRFKDKFIPDIYKELMDVYKGELRDRVLVFFALNILNRKAGQGIFNDIISNIETSYYREVLDIHGDNNLVGKPAYNFSLEDTSGRLVKMEEFMGKVAFVDFWFTGCAGCNQYYDKVLAKVEEHFKGNSNVIFVAISIDTDKKRWMEGIRSGKYTSPEVVNLYTNGKGEAHPVIENYRVLSYPRPVLIDRNGNIFSNNNDELRSGGAEKLIETIDKALEKNQVDHGNMN